MSSSEMLASSRSSNVGGEGGGGFGRGTAGGGWEGLGGEVIHSVVCVGTAGYFVHSLLSRCALQLFFFFMEHFGPVLHGVSTSLNAP